MVECTPLGKANNEVLATREMSVRHVNSTVSTFHRIFLSTIRIRQCLIVMNIAGSSFAIQDECREVTYLMSGTITCIRHENKVLGFIQSGQLPVKKKKGSNDEE